MKKQILLIEDDLDLRENIAEMLEIEGYEVEKLVLGDAKRSQITNSYKVIICNESTLDLLTKPAFRAMRSKAEKVIMLCADINDRRFHYADLKIAMPFEESTLIESISRLLEDRNNQGSFGKSENHRSPLSCISL